ncbi:N-acetyltransferase [Staphylococcus simulans]
MGSIKHLDINYKTDELFENFRETSNPNLALIDEFAGEMIDASSESPFYGIFVGEKIAARMALYENGEVEEQYFPDYNHYLVLWKLEVLSDYQSRGLGTELVNFAKEKHLPIKAIARNQSKDFFIKHGFKDVEAKNPEGYDVLIWEPKH